MLNYLWAGMIFIGIIYAAFTGQMPDITDAAINSSKEAVTLCITMMGVMSFWVGLLIMLALVWGIAITGIIIKGFWVFCPKWVSSVLYISMGWICVLAFSQILNNLTRAEFGWLLAGGIIYTIGGVIYALKLPIFNSKHKNFGSHEIFHLFVMGGSACHFVVMYSLL